MMQPINSPKEFPMKKILALSGLLLAMNGFAQSYMILNSGVTLTTDKAGFAYDFGHFIPPYKVNLTGGNFLSEDEKLITIDEKGFLYRKDEKAPKKIKGKGTNYFIADSGDLFTVDAQGFLFKYDKDSQLKKAANFGGNFFTVNADPKKKIVDFYTVNSKGNYFKLTIPGLNPNDIATFGGNFFMTNKGVAYTVSKEGTVFSKEAVKAGLISKKGGNYFVDNKGVLFTVSEDGYLISPALPMNLKVADITKLGSNYFLDNAGKLFAVDSAGNVYEREIKDHDLRNTKIHSF
jgi:hypothetical protein